MEKCHSNRESPSGYAVTWGEADFSSPRSSARSRRMAGFFMLRSLKLCELMAAANKNTKQPTNNDKCASCFVL